MNYIKTWHERTFDKWDKPMSVYMQEEITDLRTALADRDAEIAVLRADWKKVTHENGIVRAAAQQALEWFEWLNGDKTQGAATGTDVHDALTAALK